MGKLQLQLLNSVYTCMIEPYFSSKKCQNLIKFASSINKVSTYINSMPIQFIQLFQTTKNQSGLEKLCMSKFLNLCLALGNSNTYVRSKGQLTKILMSLTQQRAKQRASAIEQQSIKYQFNISIQQGGQYEGLAYICFQLNNIPNSFFLDLKSPKIMRLIVNGNQKQFEEQSSLESGLINVPKQLLKKGPNQIVLQYRNKYDNDGSGCVSFVDVDQKQYIYTQFAPYYANRVFPCFDQPDLKGTMRLNLIAPSHWKKVLSNQNATLNGQFSQQKYSQNSCINKIYLHEYLKDKKGKMIIFPQTKQLSSYLYCFVAGDYQQMKLENTYRNIPMSLYCIQSLFTYMEGLAPFIAQITNFSMQFYQNFFGYPFSFNKYDQVFAHEFKWGAMENAGIVTFNDRLLWKQKVSTDKMHRLANTISHELSHHWFGNLVTMKWWDDLWLNESFADFISHFCLQNISKKLTTIKFQSSMAAFSDRKDWGYREDQRCTTHPIRGHVADTSVADSLFDGITYSKGAACIKQLMFIIKEENFSKALHKYFSKYAFKNATLDDLIDELQNQFDIKEFTLAQWKKEWLETCSLNKLQTQYDFYAKSSSIKIKQSPIASQYSTLRHHKIRIGLFKDTLQVDEMTAVLYPREVNEIQLQGTNQQIANYRGILLNYDDHSFVKIVIDPVSRIFFTSNLTNIKDILTRNLIWKSFYKMVKDAQLISEDYINIVINNILNETSDSIFQSQIQNMVNCVNEFTPSKFRKPLKDRLFNFIIAALKDQHKQNRAIVLKQKLVLVACSQQHLRVLLSWKSNEHEVLSKYQMTIGLKWSTITLALSLKEVQLPEKQSLLIEQLKEDPSDSGKLKQKMCQAMLSTQEEFEQLYNQYRSAKNSMSIAVRTASANGWNSAANYQRTLEYQPRYFSDIPEVAKQLKGDHMIAFIRNLKPIHDDLQRQINSYSEIKFNQQNLSPIIVEIKKIVEDLKLRQKVYDFFYQQMQSRKQ